MTESVEIEVLGLSSKAMRYNKKAGSPKSHAQEIIQALTLQSGMVVFDVGAGGGYFTALFSNSVGPHGLVYALDTDPEMLDYISEQIQSRNISNVKVVLVSSNRFRHVPTGIADLIFMRNMAHHLDDRLDYFKGLKPFLKPTGRVAIIDYTKGGWFSWKRWFGHYVERYQLEDEMRRAGFYIVEQMYFLPEQSFTIFALKH